ncbi:MAG: electron transport complex protein RnfG [Phenylobacterium sp.]|jgi:electron transport complex protein RnfG
MKESIKNNGLALAGYAAVCTLLVAVVHMLTKDTIIEQEQKVLLQTLNAVLPSDAYDNELAKDCILVIDKPALGNDKPHQLYRAYKDGQPAGAIIETTAPDGYTGSIQLMTAFLIDGTVTGVRVLKHQETPGLGDKIDERKSDWIDSFNGYKVKGEDDQRWAVKKDNGIFDQFTGATITPRAVVQSVKNTALYFQQNHSMIFASEDLCPPQAQTKAQKTSQEQEQPQ